MLLYSVFSCSLLYLTAASLFVSFYGSTIKRAALISLAVTKGLDPTVPMKDSDVEWLGEIPKQWEVLPLKRLAKIRYGLGQPPAQLDEGTPFIRATNVKSGVIVDEG